MSQLNIFLLGSPRLERDGVTLNIDTRKGLALFAYLAAERVAYGREELATFFWPDHDPKRARAALRNALWGLNKVIGNSWLISDRETISLDTETDIWIDIRAFEERLAPFLATSNTPMLEDYSTLLPLLIEAVSLYQGEFLSGFSLKDSPDFDAWQVLQQSHFRQSFATTLEKLVEGYSQQNNLDSALTYARRWVEAEPLHEPAHRQLMQLYMQTGQRSEALQQFQECESLLTEALNVTPSVETVALYEAIQAEGQEVETGQLGQKQLGQKQSDADTTPADVSTIFIADQQLLPPNNLPTPMTPFIGRTQALAEIEERLADPTCRLLTLIGSGGIGKTRLVIQTASNILSAVHTSSTEDQMPRFIHGVYFVSLSNTPTPDDVLSTLISTIADTLKVSFYNQQSSPDAPQASLLEYLREKHLLLVFDNFEQYLIGADLLTEILTQAPHVKMLVTSRERLNLQGEWIYEVSGLDYPTQSTIDQISSGTDDAMYPTELADQYSALKLFLQSGQRSDPNFNASTEEWLQVIQICQFVEGLPLAIELAASWVRILSIAEIKQEIKQNLDFLTTKLRDLPERHRNLRVVFEGSWQLLTEQEQTVLKQMSVFRRGFRREAAAEVTLATLGSLSALVDKSLLSNRPSRLLPLVPRYEMHSIIRQYADEKLSDEAREAVRARHSHYYATFLKEREALLRGRDQTETIAEIGAERANIKSAWEWAIHRKPEPDLDIIAQSLDSLFRFYEIRSRFYLGRRQFKQAVDQFLVCWPEPTNEVDKISTIFGQLLARQGIFCYLLSDYDTGRTLLKQGLNIFRQLEPPPTVEIAFSLNHLGNIAYELAQYADAERYYQESLDLRRELGDDYGIAVTLNNLGQVAYLSGQYERAYQFSSESLTIARKLGNQWCIAFAEHNLGQIANAHGRYRESQAHYEQTLQICQAIGERSLQATTLDQLGYLAAETKQNRKAKQLLSESLKLHQEIGNKRGEANTLNDLGKVALQAGQYAEAKSLLKKSLTLSRKIKDYHGVVISLDNLGYVAEALGQDQKARRCFQEALSDALAINAAPLALNVFVGLATLLLKQPEMKPSSHNRQAQELLTFVVQHPASEQETRLHAEALLAEHPTDTSRLSSKTQMTPLSLDLSQMANKVSRLFV
ncbi:MAG: tetratricopeptide repeat protein [Chloroflexota bacterium]